MKKFLPILAAFAIAACSTDNTEDIKPKLVVEGWIESGEFPIVMITSTVTPTAEAQKVEDLSKHIERWAKVSISDGEEEVILTGLISSRYFPPYYYTTGRMRGEVGKTYKLSVDVKGVHAEAYATIPNPLPISDLQPVPYGTGDSLYLLNARFNANTHYKFFTRIIKTDDVYVPAITGMAVNQEGATEVTIRPGNSLGRPEKRPAFRKGETVWVKLCTMDASMYNMWKTLDDLIYLSTTPFFTIDTNLPGNVDGAIGYFAGYGRTEYKVEIP